MFMEECGCIKPGRDILTALPVEQIKNFHDHLNNINSNIHFTLETESDNILSYLNFFLHRCDDGRISTSLYRKPTHTNKYLDLLSHHPLQHKTSMIKALFTRASTLSSSLVEQKREEIVVSQNF